MNVRNVYRDTELALCISEVCFGRSGTDRVGDYEDVR